MDSAYDAAAIWTMSRRLGHLPIIDPKTLTKLCSGAWGGRSDDSFNVRSAGFDG
jgi:hypothetical protein